MKLLPYTLTLVLILTTQIFSQWWFQQNSGTNSYLEFVQFIDRTYGYAVGTESQGTYLLFKTTTGGTIWFEQDTLLPSSTGFVTNFYFLNSSIGWFVAYKFDETSSIYKTSDGGENWGLQFSTPPYEVVNDIQFTDPSTGFAAGFEQLGVGFVCKSTDGGNNWITLSGIGPAMMTSSLSFINSDTGWVAGSNILKTTDGGTTWVEQLDIEPNYFTTVQFVNDHTGWASSENAGVIYKTTNGGDSWFQQSVTGLTKTFFIDTLTGWLISGHDIYYTSDGGNDWSLQNSNTDNELNDICFINRMEGWAVGANGTILYTPYGGNPWSLDFEDDFDQYTSGQQLACQNFYDWTTWNLIPCDPVEDPYISSVQAYSYPNSVEIVHWNNLIKSLENIATNRDYINFRIYIPSGKTGYFSILSEFSQTSSQTGMECYFDADGTGRLMMVPGAPVTFDYSQSEWHYVQVVVDFYSDEAEFWFDGSQIYTWQWSQNGTITDQLAVNNFYGPSTTSEFYIDDYLLHSNCLYCLPPPEPENLTVEEIFNDDPVVQLNWEYNSLAAGIKILRKNGLPGDPGNFEQIGTAEWNVYQYVDSNVVVDSTYTYGIMAYNIYGNSDTSNLASITVLPVPVELISFTGRTVDDDVVLEWRTATETNNKGFEVERSNPPLNPSSSLLDPTESNDLPGGEMWIWEDIGFVKGNGTTTEMHSYSYTDKNLSPGKYVYRLKQIDFDGSYEYSKEAEVNVTAPLVFLLEQNYPNPFNPVTTIKYSIPRSTSSPLPGGGRGGLVTLKVYNTLGEEVATLVNEHQSAGRYEVKFNGSNLPSGVYIYRLSSGRYSSAKKLLLLK
jgi:photosystem II stability/assembly factor-like uncharacterized protein